jgi:hypothetical protein
MTMGLLLDVVSSFCFVSCALSLMKGKYDNIVAIRKQITTPETIVLFIFDS